jgi:hypothetical protein
LRLKQHGNRILNILASKVNSDILPSITGNSSP